jgi:DNA helicase INO80
MLVFWKRNEKEEREQRRKAEKAALEKLRQEEEEREAKRQARKLNFLITQTELYSHFIGRKVTAGRDDDEDTKQEDTTPGINKLDANNTGIEDNSMELDIEGHDGPMGEIDFDNDDDATIQARARLNAQAALEKQAAQTRQFDAVARGKCGDNDAAATTSTGPIDCKWFIISTIVEQCN